MELNRCGWRANTNGNGVIGDVELETENVLEVGCGFVVVKCVHMCTVAMYMCIMADVCNTHHILGVSVPNP